MSIEQTAWQHPKSGHELILQKSGDEWGSSSALIRSTVLREGFERSEYVAIALGSMGEEVEAITKILPALGWVPADSAIPADACVQEVANLHQRKADPVGKGYCQECTAVVQQHSPDGYERVEFPCTTYLAATGQRQP